MRKSEKIKLKAGDNVKSFSAEQAEKILRMPRQGGWAIAEPEKYTFTRENGINRVPPSPDKGE